TTVISIISVNGLLYRRSDPSPMLRPIGRRAFSVDEDFQYPGYYNRRELYLGCGYHRCGPIPGISANGGPTFGDGRRRLGWLLYGIDPHVGADTRAVGRHPRDDRALFRQSGAPRT